MLTIKKLEVKVTFLSPSHLNIKKNHLLLVVVLLRSSHLVCFLDYGAFILCLRLHSIDGETILI